METRKKVKKNFLKNFFLKNKSRTETSKDTTIQKKEIQEEKISYNNEDQKKISNCQLKIESKFKGNMEKFIKEELGKIFNQVDFSCKKNKNHYDFIINLNSIEESEKIISLLLMTHHELYTKNELKIYKNEIQLNQNEIEFYLNTGKEENILGQNINHNSELEKSEYLNNQITLENVSDNFDKEKLYEIFFIYGDIVEISTKKEEKKSSILFKYDSSAEKALRKFNKSQNFKSFTIRKSFKSEKIETKVKNFISHTGNIIYIKFIVGSILEIDEMKKILKKYGEILKIFRKIEGRSYFIEFKEKDVSGKIIKDYKKGLLNINNIDFKNIIVDFAYNKTEIENKIWHDIYEIDKKEISNIENEKLNEIIQEKESVQNKEISEEPNIESIQKINYEKIDNFSDKIETLDTEIKVNQAANQFDALDINKYWQTYYDPTYSRNYYYNPFLNESVWELPEGAQAMEIQTQTEPAAQVDLAMQESYIPNTTELNYNNEDNLSQSYYDEEAWEEEELREKIIWDKLKKEQLKEWMKRPARKQVADTRRDTAYIEGNYDYNIWYDKYLTDRKEEKEKIPAMHRCNPALDTGFTKADLQEKEGGAYFCLYFAKGCCSEGVNCRYYHRVPTKEDVEKIENLRDVFGRSRFATHRNDMGGVGTFTRDCRTLYVSDLKMVDSANPIKDMIRIIYDNFSPWGEVEDINYIPTKAACFIRFSNRCFAEFAKEAMMDQSLVGEEILGVKWAFDDPNPMMKKKIEKEHENRFLSAHLKKQENKKELLRKKRNNPNSDYYSFYNNRNNPYAQNKFDYESGYGYDDSVCGNYIGGDIYDNTQQITKNCVKLSETLRMIDENFKNDHN